MLTESLHGFWPHATLILYHLLNNIYLNNPQILKIRLIASKSDFVWILALIWGDNFLKFNFMFFNIGIMISPLQFVMKLKWSNVYETLGLCSRNGVYYHNNEISELKYFYYNLIQSFHFTVVETILKSQWCVCVHPLPSPRSPPPSSEAPGGALCFFMWTW